MSDTEPEADSDDSDQGGVVSAFTTIVESLEQVVELIDEEEELMESKFEKMDEQNDIHTAYSKLYKVSKKHEKLYQQATRKLSEVELEQEELSTSPPRFIRLIKPLEHCGLRITFLLKRLRNWMLNYFR